MVYNISGMYVDCRVTIFLSLKLTQNVSLVECLLMFEME